MKKTMRITIIAVLLVTMLFGVGFCDENPYWDGEYPTTAEMEAFEKACEQYSSYEEAKAAALGSSTGTNSAETATPKPAPTPEPKKCIHTYTSEVTTYPTCKAEGIRTYTCDNCGDSYTEPVPVTDKHNYIEEVTKEATCIEDGEATYTCPVCGDTYTDAIPCTGHNYIEEVTKEATCIEDGERTTTCTVCEDTYTDKVPALGHTEGEWEVIKANSMFAAGEQVKKCTTCNAVMQTEVIPSQYPIWYLYLGIGLVGVVIVGLVVLLVINKKKRK